MSNDQNDKAPHPEFEPADTLPQRFQADGANFDAKAADKLLDGLFGDGKDGDQ